MKDVRGQGLFQCRHFAEKGEWFFRSGRPHFLVQKTSDFSKIMVCPHEQRGWASSADIFFWTRGEKESIFRNFVRTFLWTVPHKFWMTLLDVYSMKFQSWVQYY